MGLEPTYLLQRQNLNLVRLPFRHSRMTIPTLISLQRLHICGRHIAAPLIFFWCEKRDLNPYVINTRPSNVRVCQFHHSRNQSRQYYYTHLFAFVKYKIKNFYIFLILYNFITLLYLIFSFFCNKIIFITT